MAAKSIKLSEELYTKAGKPEAWDNVLKSIAQYLISKEDLDKLIAEGALETFREEIKKEYAKTQDPGPPGNAYRSSL